MENTGMARRIDDLGRIVLPSEMRRLFGINPGDELAISVEGDAILLRKIQVGCTFCDGVGQLREHHGKQVCSRCRTELALPADGERDSDG